MLVELVLVLVLVGFGLWSLKNSTPSSDSVKTDQTTTGNTTNGGGNIVNPTATISYQNALVQYKDARIQLEGNCQASPDNSTFKNGANIMIDNRSDKTRTVKVGSTFTIKPWGFKIVNLYSPSLPATWYVDCDASQNVATILIQK